MAENMFVPIDGDEKFEDSVEAVSPAPSEGPSAGVALGELAAGAGAGAAAVLNTPRMALNRAENRAKKLNARIDRLEERRQPLANEAAELQDRIARGEITPEELAFIENSAADARVLQDVMPQISERIKALRQIRADNVAAAADFPDRSDRLDRLREVLHDRELQRAALTETPGWKDNISVVGQVAELDDTMRYLRSRIAQEDRLLNRDISNSDRDLARGVIDHTTRNTKMMTPARAATEAAMAIDMPDIYQIYADEMRAQALDEIAREGGGGQNATVRDPRLEFADAARARAEGLAKVFGDVATIDRNGNLSLKPLVPNESMHESPYGVGRADHAVGENIQTAARKYSPWLRFPADIDAVVEGQGLDPRLEAGDFNVVTQDRADEIAREQAKRAKHPGTETPPTDHEPLRDGDGRRVVTEPRGLERDRARLRDIQAGKGDGGRGHANLNTIDREINRLRGRLEGLTGKTDASGKTVATDTAGNAETIGTIPKLTAEVADLSARPWYTRWIRSLADKNTRPGAVGTGVAGLVGGGLVLDGLQRLGNALYPDEAHTDFNGGK